MVCEFERCRRPRALKATLRRVATTHGVGTEKRDNLSIIKAHAIEDRPELLGSVVAAGEAAGPDGNIIFLRISTPHVKWHFRTSHGLYRHNACKLPQVGIAQVRYGGVDGLEHVPGGSQAIVGREGGSTTKAHQPAWTAAAVTLVVGAGVVPGKADKDGPGATRSHKLVNHAGRRLYARVERRRQLRHCQAKGGHLEATAPRGTVVTERLRDVAERAVRIDEPHLTRRRISVLTQPFHISSEGEDRPPVDALETMFDQILNRVYDCSGCGISDLLDGESALLY
mmetsp:Transcript_17707/g.55922  ORF Transcript_17707/g.55922 Transcript_17707/m.55922 type:complete len:283 (+) Transcript_17707:4880-5728(+)